MQTYPHGTLGTWRVWNIVRTLCSPFSTRSGLCWMLLFPPLWHYLNNILLFFFNLFLSLNFSLLLCCVVQCFTLLVPSMVISPNGRLGKWRTCNRVRTLFPPSPPRSGLILPVSFFLLSFVCALIIFSINVPFNCSPLFSKCFPTAVSRDHCAVANGNLCLQTVV